MAKEEQQSGASERRYDCVVEFGDANCRTITLNTFRERVRGTFSLRVLAARNVGNRAVGEKMGQMPDIPGLRMALDIKRRFYRLFDPLKDDPDLKDKISAVLKKASVAADGIKEVPERSAELDEDTWKTLIIELCRKKEGGSLTVTKGELPPLDRALKMDGRQLSDPWDSSRAKPRFEEDMEEYHRRIDAQV